MSDIFYIPDDVFMPILSYLPDKSIGALNVSNTLTNKVIKAKNNNALWKEHTEVLFGKFLNIDLVNWKSVYAILQKSIKKENPFLIDVDNPNAIVVLIEAGYDPSMNNNSAVKNLILSGHIRAAKYMLENFGNLIDPSTGDNLAMRIAAQKGYEEIIWLPLQYSTVDPSSGNNLALEYALKSKNAELVKILLKHPNVNPSAHNDAISYAFGTRNTEAVKFLLKNSRVNTEILLDALSSAVKGDDIEIINLLKDDPRITNNMLYLGLLDAINYGKSNPVKLLQNNIIDPFVRNELVKLALSKNNTYIVKFLLEDHYVYLSVNVTGVLN